MKETKAFVTKERTLHQFVSNFWDVQHTRILLENRFNATQNNALGIHVDKLREVEKSIALDIRQEVQKYPICEWIISQRGLGYELAGQLVGIIQDIGRFSNVSKLWAYFGLAVIDVCEECKRPYYPPETKANKIANLARRLQEQYEKKIVKEGSKDFEAQASEMVCQCERPKLIKTTQKARKGVLGDYNPQAKMLAYKIGAQFVKQGAEYRDLYDQFRKEYEARPDLQAQRAERAGKVSKKGTSKGTAHIHAMAMRRVEKLFLSHLWAEWRKLEGLPLTEPYAIAQLGHADYIPPPKTEAQGK